MKFGFFNFKKLVIGVALTCLVVGGGGFAATKLLSAPKEQENEEYVDNQTAFLTKPTDGTTPKDHTILENIEIAAGVLNDNPHFKGISKGHAITNMVIQNDQNVYTERRVDGDYAMVNTVTSSSFVKSATQKFFTSKNASKIFMRNGSVNDFDLSLSTFSDEVTPTAYAREDFLSIYGWAPYQLCSYIFAENSLLESESSVLPSTEYSYVVEAHLDLENSIAQSKREVKTNGGAIAYPTYSEVVVTLCLNDDWQVQRMIYHDTYEITVKMGVALTAPVDDTITEDFYYDEGEYEIDEATKAYYAKYADLDTSSGEEGEKEKTALDYIEESMLGMALGGSTLDVNAKVDDYDVNGKIYCKFNIKTTTLKFAALFDDFYLKYDKSLYISYRKYNYTLNESYFTHLLDALNLDVNTLMDSFSSGDGLPSSGETDENGIIAQLSDLKLAKPSEGKVVVSGGMDYEGITLNFAINMTEDSDGAILDSIEASAKVNGKDISLNIAVGDEDIVFEDKEYVDLSSTSWFIDEMINIVHFEGYQDDIVYNYKDYHVTINTTVDKNKNALVSTNITYPGKEDIKFDLYYYNENMYFSIGNIALQVTKEDNDELIQLISQYMSSNTTSTEVTISMDDINHILETSYEVFDGVSTNENGDIIISLALSKLYEGLQDTQITMYQDGKDLCFDTSTYDFKMRLSENKNEIEFDNKDYLDVASSKVCIDYYKNIVSTINSGTYTLKVNDLTLVENDMSISINALFTTNENNIYAKANVIVNDEEFVVTFNYDANDDYYYVTFDSSDNSIKLKANKEDILTFYSELEKQYYALSEQYEINKLVNDYITKTEAQLEEELSKNKMDIDQVLPLLYDAFIYIQNSSLNIENGNIYCVGPNNQYDISLTHEDNNYSINLKNLVYEEYNANGKITIIPSASDYSISKEEYVNIDEVIKSLGEFTYELNQNNITLGDIASKAMELSEYEGYAFSLTTTYTDYTLNATFYYDHNKNALGKVIILDKSNNEIRLDVAYDNNKLYIVYGNIAFEATNDDISQIAYLIKQNINIQNNKMELDSGDTLINGTYINLKEILNKVFNVYKGIDITSDNINISVALSSLDKNISDITLTMYEVDNTIYCSSSEYNILMSLKEYKEDICFDDTLNYMSEKDVNNTYDLVLSLGNCLISDTISLSINNITLTNGDLTYYVSGNYAKNGNSYSLSFDVTGDIETSLSLYNIDGTCYLNISYSEYELNLVGSYSLMKQIILDTYNNRYGLIKEETLNKYYDQYLAPILESDNDVSVDEVLPYVYQVLYKLQSATLTLSENSIIFSYEGYSLKVEEQNNEFSVLGDVEIKNYQASMNLSLNNNEVTIVVPSKDYFNIDEIIKDVDSSLIAFAESSYTIEDLVALCKEIKDYSNYEICVDYNYGAFKVNLDIEIGKKLHDAALTATITKDNEKLELTLIYENDAVYVTFGNVSLNLSKEDLDDLASIINDYLKAHDLTSDNDLEANKAEIQSILNKISAVYNGITFTNDGNVDVALLLSKVGYNDTVVTIGTNDEKELFLSCDSPSIYVTLKNLDSIMTHNSELTYLTRTEYDAFIEDLNKAKDIVGDAKQICISVNDVEVKYNDVTGKVNGYIYSNNGQYGLVMDISGTYNGSISLNYVDSIYYLDMTYGEYEVKVSLSNEDLMDLVDTLIENRVKLFGDLDAEEYINIYLKPIIDRLNQNGSLEESLENVFDVLLEIEENGYLTYSDGKFSVKYLANEITYVTSDNQVGIYFTSQEIDGFVLTGVITLNNNQKEFTPSGKYYSLDLLVNKITMVVDAYAKSNLTINDLYTDFNHVVDYKGYQFNVSYSYKEYKVNAIVYVTKNGRVEGNVILSNQDKEDITLKVQYINDTLYVIYENIALKVENNDFNDVIELVNKYFSLTTSEDADYGEILDKALNVFSSFSIDENNHILIGLALSTLVDSDDISLDFYYDEENDRMLLYVNEYGLSIECKEYRDSITLDKSITYLDRASFNKVVDTLELGKDIVTSDEIVVTLTNIKVVYDNTTYIINGTLVKNNNDYEANINVKISNKEFNIDIIRINKKYYMDITAYNKTFNMVLSEEEIVNLFMDIYEGRGGLLNDEDYSKLETEYIQKYTDLYNELKAGDYSSLQGDVDIDKTLANVYDVLTYMKDCQVSVEDNSIIYSDKDIHITLSSENSVIKVEGTASVNNISVEASIEMESKAQAISLDSSITYVNMDEVVGKLDKVVLAVSNSNLTLEDFLDEYNLVKEYQGYAIDVEYNYNADYKVTLNLDITKSCDVHAIVTIASKEENVVFNIYYVDKVVYVVYGGTYVKLDEADCKDGMNLILNYLAKKNASLNEDLTNEDYQNILDRVCDMLTSFEVDSNNHLIIDVALTKALKSADDLSIDISWNNISGEISINSTINYDISAIIYESTDAVKVPSYTYLDREDLQFILDSIDDIDSFLLQNKTYTLSINDVHIQYKDVDVTLNGVIKQNDKNIYVKLIALYKEDTYTLIVTKVEDNYYLDYTKNSEETISLMCDEEAILTMIDTILDDKNIILGDMSIGDYYDKYLVTYLGERKAYTIDEILSMSFEALKDISEGSLTCNNNIATITHDKLNITFSKENAIYTLAFNVNDIEQAYASGNITLKSEENTISVSSNTYYDASAVINNMNQVIVALIDGGWSLDDVASFIKELCEFKGASITITTLKQAGFTLSGNILIDQNMNVSLYLDVQYGENETSFNLYYYENDFYLSWNSYNLYLEHDDIIDTIEVIMDFAGMKKMELSDVYEAIDRVNEVFVSATGTKGEKLTLTLALSQLYEELSDTTIDIVYDGSFNLSSTDDNLLINIANYTDEATKPSFDKDDCYTRQDFDVLMDYANGFRDYLNAGELSLSFEDTSNPLTISMGEDKEDLVLHGSVNLKTIKNEEETATKITFSAKVYMTGYMHYYFALEYTEEENLYITFSTSWNDNYGDLISKTSVSLTRSQVVKMLKDVLTGIDENSEIGKKLSSQDISNINTVKKLLVDTGVIDKTEISIGKIDSNLGSIVPTVFKVLDFIKDATIKPNREDRSIHVEKDYDIVSGDTTISTSTNITLYQEENGDSTNYICSINELKISNQISINGNVTIKKFEDEVYVDMDNVISLAGIDNFTEALFNSIEHMTFDIKGTITAKILTFSVPIDMEIRVKYVDGVIKAYIYLDIEPVYGCTTCYTAAYQKYVHTTIYIDDQDIYMYKDECGKSFWLKTEHLYSYRKNTYKGFMKNMMDEVIFIFNLQSTIVDAMESSDEEFSVVANKLLKSYTYSNDTYSFDIDLKSGLSSSMFSSDLIINLSTDTYNDEILLKGMSGSLTLFSIINGSFEFTEYGCFGNEVDMSVYPSDIASNSNYTYYNE